MKLHHLRLRGIGPFRDEAAIDLAALGTGGTFLLEGPTGSGKSTILDAIVFALYGGVAGEGAGTDRIRSQFSDPSEPSLVDLVFETTAGIFRVRRSPQYERPKKRGTGTTTQQAKALLWHLSSPEVIPAAIADATGDGAGVEVRATRLDEVGAQIREAIGLTREQFTQTVLLPQGEFQRFLRASTDDRQRVLTKVFGTELYEHIENELVARRKDAKSRESTAQEVLGRAVERFTEASGHQAAPVAAPAEAAPIRDSSDEDGAQRVLPEGMLDLGLSTEPEPETPAPALAAEETAPETEQEEPAPVPLLQLVTERNLDRLGEDAQAIADLVAAEAEQLTSASEAAARKLSTARGLALAREGRLRQLERRRELDRLADRLQQARPQHDEDRSRLALHEAAVPVHDALQRRDRAATRAEETAARVRGIVDGLTPALADLAARLDQDDPLAALRAVTQEETAAVGRLDALLELEKGLTGRAEQISTRTRAQQTARDAVAQLDEQLAARPEALAALQQRLQTERAEAEKLAEARVAESTAAQRRTAAQEAAGQEQAIARATQALQHADTAAQQAIDHEHALRSRRRAGLAAELAQTLEAGQACAVCGATEHPAPATPAADHVDEHQLEAAEASRQQAEAALGRARAALDLAAQRRDDARERAGGLDLDAATAALEQARAAVAAAQQCAQRAAATEKEISAHEQTTASLREKRQQQENQAQSIAAWIAEATERLTADRSTVEEARGDSPSIAERARGHRDRADAATALREAQLAADQARAQRSELTAEAERLRAEARAALAAGQEATGLSGGDSAADADADADAEAPAPASGTGIAADALDTDDDVRAAVLDPAERSALQGRLEQHRLEQQRLADGLAEPGIAEITATEEAIDAARLALVRAQESVTAHEQRTAAAQAAAGTAEHTARRTAEAHQHLTGAIGQVESVTREAGAVIRVADLATGVAGDRVRLSTFVLMRRFEDVVDAANARLARMGDANLELLRQDAVGGRGKTGLDLLVIDRRTDRARRPDTLSGGETFIVSLALALGLADTVSAEAGGITMQTLFIDEGFGSLDPERLDGVVEEISRIAEGGRSVGIVSHVAELKTRIPDRISVRRGPDMTSRLTVTA